jgi:hypothetical protein
MGLPVMVLLLAAGSTSPTRGVASAVLHVLGLIALAGNVVVVGILAALAVTNTRRSKPAEEVAESEEPLLGRVMVPRCARDRPLVGVIGLEDGAGASTLAFNLAMVVAADSQRTDSSERPLPVCLLSEGGLADRLGLSAAPLRDYLSRHPGSLGEDVLAMAKRLGGLIDVICLPTGEIGGARLKRLVATLQRRYDLVVVEATARDRFLAAAVAEQADVVMGCVAARTRGMHAAGLGAVAALTPEHKTVMVVNRQVEAGKRSAILPQLIYRVDIPLDPCVERADRAGRPWVLWHTSPAGIRMREITNRLLPQLMGSKVEHAA